MDVPAQSEAAERDRAGPEQVRAEAALRESEARLAADLAGMRRLHEVHAVLAGSPDFGTALDEILDAAVTFTNTDRGTIQLISADGELMEIVRERGYPPGSAFTEHFRSNGFAQGRDAARTERQRLIIEDTSTFPGLVGTADGEATAASGVAAAQSTPMVSRNGEMLGVLSTQFREPHRPTDDQLRLIDLLAWTAAEYISRHRADQALREGQERQAFLLKLSDTLRPLNDAAEIVTAASEALGRHLGAGQVVYAESDAEGDHVTIEREWNDGSIPSNARTHRLDAFGPGFIADLRAGHSTAIPDVARDPRTASSEALETFARASIKAVLNVPLIKNGRLIAVLGVHSSAPHAWRPEDVAVAEEVAERLWAAVERARSEAALRASEERLRSALEIDTVGVLFWSPDFTLKQVNEAFCAITGFSREEAVGLSWQQLTPPEFHAASENAVAQIEATGRAEPYQKQYFRKDGSRWWGLFAPRRLADGEVVEFVLDITDRHRQTEALRESEARYRVIVEEAKDYAIFTMDARNRIDSWPPGAAAVFGWTAEEAIGQSAAILFTPEDRANGQPQREFETARDRGVASDTRWLLRKDGSRVFIEGSTRALRGADESFSGLLKIGQDVTERRATETALRESEGRFRSFAENSADTLWICDVHRGQLEYLSPAYELMFGETRDTVMKDLGRWGELVHPEDRERVAEGMPKLLEGAIHQQEYRILRASDGTMRWLEDTGFPIRDENGEVSRTAGIVQDITERKHAAEHQKMLAAELQHRVRNTLAIVRSIARRTAASSDTVDEYAAHVDGRVNALARTQAAVTRDPLAGVPLDELIGEELLAYGAREGGQVTLSGPSLRLKPKPAESMGLAIHELATNSVKYGALSIEEGEIAVTWSVEHGDGDGAPRLRFDWRERSPAITGDPPRRRGFGTELLERTLAYELKAKTALDFTPGQFHCTVAFALKGQVVTPAAGGTSLGPEGRVQRLSPRGRGG